MEFMELMEDYSDEAENVDEYFERKILKAVFKIQVQLIVVIYWLIIVQWLQFKIQTLNFGFALKLKPIMADKD